MKSIILPLLLSLVLPLVAQDYYFPPVNNDDWEIDTDIILCADQVDTLLNLVEERNTHAFIVLHKGRIVIEEYFGDFEQDDAWYWASAGKTLASFLTGIAQEDGLLDINHSTSDYLGAGWTSATTEQEEAITIWHQLTMTTGLDYEVDDLNCLNPSCLIYKNEPGTEWFYHNAPYRLTQDVLEEVSGIGMTFYTTQKLGPTCGISGVWNDYIFFSRPRSMARFGSLILNDGVWDGQTILGDMDFINAMRTPSQSINESYGYFWWLNGQNSHRLPGTTLTFQNEIIPNAPSDMYAALGLNDQKLYIVPSMDLVVVRMGDDAATGGGLFALTEFDNLLWERLPLIFCEEITANEEPSKASFQISPNPVESTFALHNAPEFSSCNLIDIHGKVVADFSTKQANYSMETLPAGIYFVQIWQGNQLLNSQKIIRL